MKLIEKPMENLFELLNEALEQLMDMWRAADDSVADYTLQIETAVNFIKKALGTKDRLDIFKAFQKAFDVLEKEYDETPADEEYDDLVDRIRAVLDGLNEDVYIKESGNDQSKNLSRRDFLKTIGSALAGMGIIGPVSSISQIPQGATPITCWGLTPWGGPFICGVYKIPSGFSITKSGFIMGPEDPWHLLLAKPGSAAEQKLQQMGSDLLYSEVFEKRYKASIELKILKKTKGNITLKQLEQVSKEYVEKNLRRKNPQNKKSNDDSQNDSSHNFRSRFDYAGGNEDDDYAIYKENKNYIKKSQLKVITKEILKEVISNNLNEIISLTHNKNDKFKVNMLNNKRFTNSTVAHFELRVAITKILPKIIKQLITQCIQQSVEYEDTGKMLDSIMLNMSLLVKWWSDKFDKKLFNEREKIDKIVNNFANHITQLNEHLRKILEDLHVKNEFGKINYINISKQIEHLNDIINGIIESVDELFQIGKSDMDDEKR